MNTINHLVSLSKDSEFDRIQYVFANHIILLSAGAMELGLEAIINEYCFRHANDNIRNFMGKRVSWLNSIGMEKLQTFVKDLSPDSWHEIDQKITPEERTSIDSVKAIRDKIAHGRYDGTGTPTASKYYINTSKALIKICEAFLN